MSFRFLLPQEGLSGRNGLMSLQFSDWISFCALIVSIFSLILSYERTRVTGPKFCIEKILVEKKLNPLTDIWKINVKLRIINKGDRRGILDYQYRIEVYKKYKRLRRTSYGLIQRSYRKNILNDHGDGTSGELDVGNSKLINISFVLPKLDLGFYLFVDIIFRGEYKDWKNRYKDFKYTISFPIKIDK